jgi:hypothetical protein|tara:strand:- start:3833 stop:5593 length:1761 start_codon:yes stop_codon:yes gene_type:complete
MTVSKEKIYNYLISKGLTRNQALGMIVNIQAESAFDSAAVGDNGASYGLFQHNLSRRDAMVEYIKENYDDKDWKTNWKGQIDYALTEKDTQTYMGIQFDSPEEASKWFTINWERPQDKEKKAEERISVLEDYKNEDWFQPKKEKAPEVTYSPPVIGPDGEVISGGVPQGDDVDRSDIERSLEENKGIVQKYSSWDDFYNNYDKVDLERPIQIGDNPSLLKFKQRPQGAKGDGEFFIIGDDGKFLARGGQRLTPFGIVDKEDPNYTQLLLQREARRKYEERKKLETQQKAAEVVEEIEEKESEINVDDLNDEEYKKYLEDNGYGFLSQDKSRIFETSEERDEYDNSLKVPQTVETEEEAQEQTTPQPETKQKSTLGALGDIGGLIDGLGGVPAIIAGVMGAKGYNAAMKKIQVRDYPELSTAFKQQLYNSEQLAKIGFTPEEERAIRDDIDAAYRSGIENMVRGTAGDRAKFLATSGVLDANRSNALLKFAAEDAAVKRQNQANHNALLQYAEEYNSNKSIALRQEELAMQMQNKQSAAEFASSAFAYVMDGIQDARRMKGPYGKYVEYINNKMTGNDNSVQLETNL